MKRLMLNIILLAYPLWAPYLFWIVLMFLLWLPGLAEWMLVLLPCSLVIGLLMAIYYGPINQSRAVFPVFKWLFFGVYFIGSLIVMFQLLLYVFVHGRFWPF